MRMNSLTQTLEQWLPVIDPARPMTLAAWLVVYGVPAVAFILLAWWFIARAAELGSTLGEWLPLSRASATTPAPRLTTDRELSALVEAYDVRRPAKVVPIASRRAGLALVVLLAGASSVAAQETRSALFLSLEAGTAMLQAYDWKSTTKALELGARERNQVVAGVAGHPVAWGVIKAGVTIGTIAAAERLWRDHRKKSAIGLLLLSNGVMTVVAVNNARVIGGRR